jgi:hypothetical protein
MLGEHHALRKSYALSECCERVLCAKRDVGNFLLRVLVDPVQKTT